MNEHEIRKLHELERGNWWFRAKDDLILKLLGPSCSGTVCDVGCCSGRLLGKIHGRHARGGLDLIGVDPSELALRLAEEDTSFRYIRGHAEQLELADASVDVLVASDVLEHTDDDGRALDEFRRVLKSGGALLITVPAGQWLWSEHDRALEHRRRYHLGPLRRRLVDRGFRIERSGYFFGAVFPLFVVSRLLSRLRKPKGPMDSLHDTPPRAVNEALYAICRAELGILPFPCGSTVFVRAVKGPA
ncbi:MAG: class I SAM-dependent methyltransferase [Pirellulales bacterium]|nr:class I SAM-dependent methyltransferase [Pirellulales bacterium]